MSEAKQKDPEEHIMLCLATPKPSARKQASSEEEEKAKLIEASQLLPQIPADEYQVWFEVGCALKHLGAEFSIFRNWSAKSPKFNAEKCRLKWDELPDEPRAGISTIRRYAGIAENIPSKELFTAPPEEMLSPPSTDAEQVRQAAKFILTIFRPDEYFELCDAREIVDRWIPNRGEGTSSFAAETTEDELCQDSNFSEYVLRLQNGAYIGENPVKAITAGFPRQTPADNSVTDYRTGLLECDELPVEEQWKLLKQCRLPVIAIIHSGNRSLHVLCRIEAGKDDKLYRQRMEALYKYVQRKGLKPDKSCRNPSRLTRLPGVRRGEQLQYVVSWGWGYRDWDSFEQMELKSIVIPAEPTHKEQLIKELTSKYGPPLFFNEKGKPTSLNQQFMAHYLVADQSLINTNGILWRYNQQDGLWRRLGDAALNNLIATSTSQLAMMLYQQDVANLRTARFCQETRKFIESVPEDPFAKRPLGVIHTAQKMLIFTPDGQLETQPFAPDYYSRNSCPVEYDPTAQCPRFLHELLESALPSEDIELLQMYAGQCLLGRNITQTILVLTGTAGAGKGTIVNILLQMIGNQNWSELRTNHLGERFEMAQFIDKNLLIGSDVKSNFLLSKYAGRLKSLCGHDHLTAELKGQQEGIPLQGMFNIIITANGRLLLNVDGDADAWKRRILWLSFERPRPEHPIPDFQNILWDTERQGILNWMIEGARKLLQSGFPHENSSSQRVDLLLQESDSVYGFLRTCVERTGERDAELSSRCLETSYSSWCFRNDWTPLPSRSLQQKMKECVQKIFGLTQSHDLRNGNSIERGYRGLQFIKDRKFEQSTLF